MREAFLGYKFHEKTWHAAVYAAFLEPYVRREFPALDVVTWVPLSRRSHKDRASTRRSWWPRPWRSGWTCPAKSWWKKCVSPSSSPGWTGPRSAGPTCWEPTARAAGAAIAGRRILVVDDVITTGSTMEECCRVLAAAGAAEIHAAAVAQAGGKDRRAKDGQSLANEI